MRHGAQRAQKRLRNIPKTPDHIKKNRRNALFCVFSTVFAILHKKHKMLWYKTSKTQNMGFRS
jgi:hypothetical protein